jgi:hypothetical protein
MASQQPTHCNCKNCGSLPVARFSSTQITKYNDDDRRCASCIAKDAEEKKAASQLARLAKHAERVVIILPADAVDTRRTVSFKRTADGEPKDCVISCLKLGGRIHVPLKTSVTSRELVAAGAEIDVNISDDAVIQLPCTKDHLKDGKKFRVSFVTINGVVKDLETPINVPRFPQKTEPVVDASSMKLLLRGSDAAAQRARGTGRTWRDKGKGHDEVRQAILAGDWDLVAQAPLRQRADVSRGLFEAQRACGRGPVLQHPHGRSIFIRLVRLVGGSSGLRRAARPRERCVALRVARFRYVIGGAGAAPAGRER